MTALALITGLVGGFLAGLCVGHYDTLQRGRREGRIEERNRNIAEQINYARMQQ